MSEQEKLRTLLATVIPYLPQPVVQEHLADPDIGRVRGEYWQGSVLFADLSGFTALSETLSEMGKEGGEAITAIVNDLFGALLEDVERYGGILLKFGGDALTVYFGGDNHALRAAQTGLDLQATMARRFVDFETPWGTFTLRLRVGVHTGQVFAAQVGHEPPLPLRGMELVVTGADINRVAEAQDHAAPGDVCITAETLVQIIIQAQVEPVDEGLYQLQSLALLDPLDPTPLPVLWSPSDDEATSWLRQRFEALQPYLTADFADERITDPSDPQLQPELRLTAVLFANFADFSAILAALTGKGKAGVEAATKVLNGYYARMQDIIGRYGGIVNKVDMYTHGDKLMALFGAPIAHGDDAQRAVRAALDMQASMAEINEHIERVLREVDVAPIPLTQRIGINYGHVFAGNVGSERAGSRREYTVMGDTVNLAARLMSTAEAGGVLISPAVQRRVADTFLLETLPPVQVKGKAGAIPIYAPLRPLTERERADRRTGRRRLIGRETQLSALQSAIRTVGGGQGQVVAIVGEVGTGKTRLVEGVTDHVAQLQTVPRPACYVVELPSYARETPYWPIIDLLRRLVPLGAGAQEDADRLTQWVWTHTPDRIRFLPLLGDLLSLPIPDNQVTAALSSEQRRDRLFGLIESILYRQAEKQPSVLIFDGLQWADESSRALLSRLSETVTQAPLLLIFTYRPGVPFDTPWQELPHCSSLTVAEFAKGESADLVADLLGATELPEKLTATVYQRAQGNPFFTEEVVKSLVETQAITRDNGRWTVTQDTDSLPIPDTIEGIVLARLDRLGARCRDVLQEAAVAVRFSHSLLEKVHSQPKELSQQLSKLVREDLLREEYGQPPSCGVDAETVQDLQQALVEIEYAFRQAMTREVAYDNLLYSRRRELHKLIGQAIEILYCDRLDEYAASLARHYREAEAWESAFLYHRRAGERAQALFANQAAADYFRDALAIAQQHLPQTPLLDLVDVQKRLGDVMGFQGHYDQALAAYAEALGWVQDQGPPEVIAELDHKIAAIHESKGDYRTATEWVERGLEVLSGQEGALVARLNYFAAALSYRQGNIEQSLARCQQSLTTAQAIEAQPEIARAYVLLCVLYMSVGDLPKAMECGQKSLKIYQSLQDPVGTAKAHNNLGLAYVEQDKWAEASEHYWEGLQLSEAVGDTDAIARFSLNLGEILQFQGDVAGAVEAYTRSLDIWSEIGYLGGVAVACIGLGQVTLMQGDLQASQDYLARSRELFEDMGAQAKLTEVYRHQAMLKLAQGQPDQALSLARKSCDLAKEIKARVQEGEAMWALGKAFLALEDYAQAQDCLEASLDRFAELNSSYRFAKACHALALIYLNQPGRKAEGQALLQQSRSIFADMGAAWELAQVEAAIEAAC